MFGPVRWAFRTAAHIVASYADSSTSVPSAAQCCEGNADDRERLREVGAAYNANAILLAEWKKGSMPKFNQLKDDDWVELADVSEVFGMRRTPIGKSSAGKTSSRAKIRPSPAAVVSPSPRSLAAKKAWTKRR